jgi:hypothetical protein
MRADPIIKHEGMNALLRSLDIVEAERFIALVKRNDFDYTEWRTTLWVDESVEHLSAQAMKHWDSRRQE